MFNIVRKEMDWNGKKLVLETGKIGRQASSVVVSMGDTVVMCNAVVAKKETVGIDFVPLTVNFLEKTYAYGKIPGGYIKRETKPSTEATLIARLIDRPIRPLFPEGYHHETQVACTVLSYDAECPADVVAMIGASAALSISAAPFEGPIGGARVGYINGEMILNPSHEAIGVSDLELMVAGTKDSILMVESEANELSEEQMLKAVMFAHDAYRPVIEMIEEFASEAGTEKVTFEVQDTTTLKAEVKEFLGDKIAEAFKILKKQDRNNAIDAFKAEVEAKFITEESDDEYRNTISDIVKKLEKEYVRSLVLDKGERIDGRTLSVVRPIVTETDLLPKTHGSALFTRGETQALVITTLGGGKDDQMYDTLWGEQASEKFLLHYNFPGYSVGEIGWFRAPGRRELGHGNLAHRALKAVMPNQEEFPYVVRVVSEITESNGSSSMATVCGSSMSLMAAGVPIKKGVSGIAMGLIKEQNRFAVLSDISGDEDHLGDMDFKVAGTKDGVTALQMDIKCKGITEEIMTIALKQAHEGRMHIMSKMEESITESRKELSENAPQMTTMTIPSKKIKDVIGSGGKTIKGIIEETGVDIDIDDNGTVKISGGNGEMISKAVDIIKDITLDPQVGDIFDGTVVKVIDAGAFIKISPTKDGFVHISELANYRVDFVDDVLNEGDKVKVKVIGSDRNGRAKLSYRAIDQKTGEDISHTNPSFEEENKGSRDDRRGGRDDRRGGGNRRHDRSRDDRRGGHDDRRHEKREEVQEEEPKKKKRKWF